MSAAGASLAPPRPTPAEPAGPATPARRGRLTAALALGLRWGLFCYWNLRDRHWAAADFTPTNVGLHLLAIGSASVSISKYTGR